MKDSVVFTRALSITATHLNDQDGKVQLSLREDGEVGVVKVTEMITLISPTPSEIVEVVRGICKSGFRGNITLPRQVSGAGSYVIYKESFHNPRRS